MPLIELCACGWLYVAIITIIIAIVAIVNTIYRQADVLETLIHNHMHTNMLKIPSDRRFGNLDI